MSEEHNPHDPRDPREPSEHSQDELVQQQYEVQHDDATHRTDPALIELAQHREPQADEADAERESGEHGEEVEAPGVIQRIQYGSNGEREQPEEPEEQDHAENLKHHLGMAFGFPEHLRDAFHAWIDHVEETVSGGRPEQPTQPQPTQDVPDQERPDGEARQDARIEELERVSAELKRTVVDLLVAVKGAQNPREAIRAVADVQPPDGTSAESGAENESK